MEKLKRLIDKFFKMVLLVCMRVFQLGELVQVSDHLATVFAVDFGHGIGSQSEFLVGFKQGRVIKGSLKVLAQDERDANGQCLRCELSPFIFECYQSLIC